MNPASPFQLCKDLGFSQEDQDRLVKLPPHGYVLNDHPTPTKTNFYGLRPCTDGDQNATMVLIQFVDGTGVWIRCRSNQVHHSQASA